jgi:hypothetical protein
MLSSNNQPLISINTENGSINCKNISLTGNVTLDDIVTNKNVHVKGFLESRSAFTCNLEVYVDDSIVSSSNVFIISSYIQDENIFSINAGGSASLYGNLGIGTYPQFALHVASEAFFQESLHASNLATNKVQNMGGCNLAIRFDNSLNRILIEGDTYVTGTFDADALDFKNFFSENVSTSHYTQSNVKGERPSFQIYTYAPDTGYDHNIIEIDINYDEDPSRLHKGLYMNPYGHVGIGTNLPTHLLHLQHSVFSSIQQNGIDPGLLLIDGSAPGSVFAIDCNIHIGIGTNMPVATLHIASTPLSTIHHDSIILIETTDISSNVSLLMSVSNLETNLLISASGVVHSKSLNTPLVQTNRITESTKGNGISYDNSIIYGVSNLTCQNLYSTDTIFADFIDVQNLRAVGFSLEGLSLQNDGSFSLITLSLEQLAVRGSCSLFYSTPSESKFLAAVIAQKNNRLSQGTLRIIIDDAPQKLANFGFEYGRGLVIDGTYDGIAVADKGSASLAIISQDNGISFIELMSKTENELNNDSIGEMGFYNNGNPILFFGFRYQSEPTNKALVLKRLGAQTQISMNNACLTVNDVNETADTNNAMHVKGTAVFTSANDEPIMYIEAGINESPISRIGIRTILPSHTLHVIGGVRISNELLLDEGSSARFNGTIDGITHFTANMNVDGTIYSKGHVSTTSDRTLKTNFEVIQNPLEKIQKISGYTYDRIDRNGERETGLVAQEVQSILPEVVVKNSDDLLSIAYGNMAGLFVESIKALTQKVEDLQKEIEILKSQSQH